MRKHKVIHLPLINATCRPLTIADEIAQNNDFVTPHDLPKHHRDYAYVHAFFESKAVDSIALNIHCPKCSERIEFDLQRNQVMIEEMEDKIYGDAVKIKINAPVTGDEEIPDLIDYVVIDGDQVFWKDCKDSEKELVLDSLDYSVFKSISAALKQPSVVANIPVVCSCGYDHIVSLRGAQAFNKVMQ